MKHPVCIVVFIGVLVCSHGLSQVKQPAKGGPTPKQLAALARAKLGFLVGSYSTETHIPSTPSNPKGVTGKGTSVVTWALDSAVLFIDDENVNSLYGKYKGHGVLGYDLQNHQYVLSMFNNFGDRPTYRGDFAGDTLVLSAKVPLPGHPFDQKLIWYKVADSIKLKVMNNFGKGFILNLDQTAIPATQEGK